MSRRRPLPFRATALAAAFSVLAGCGGGGNAGSVDPPPGGTAPPPVDTAPPPGGTAPPPVVAGLEVLVQVGTGVDVQALAAAAGLSVVDQFGRRPIYRLRLPVGASIDAAVTALRADPRVVFAEPNLESETPEGTKNSFWAIGGDAGTYAAQWAPQALRLADAHRVSTGTGVRVAVLDTGIETSHPLFAGRLAATADGRLLGRDFVDDDADPSERGSAADAGFGHGTHVAGLVALAAPGAAIMPVRVLDPAGRGNAWVLSEALAWAVDPDGDPATDDGAHVVNLSLGSTARTRMLDVVVRLASCYGLDDDDDAAAEFDDPGFDDDRARCASRHGAAVYAAAGNDGSADAQWYPAAEGTSGSSAVTATTPAGALADFANRGGWIKLAAPGEAIVSAVPGGAWGTWSGTSMAAPLAAGSAALVLGTLPPGGDPAQPTLRQWRPQDLVKRIEDRSAPLCNLSIRQIDAAAAVTDTDAPAPTCP